VFAGCRATQPRYGAAAAAAAAAAATAAAAVYTVANLLIKN